jgi:RND superfamily putative drug exporter
MKDADILTTLRRRIAVPETIPLANGRAPGIPETESRRQGRSPVPRFQEEQMNTGESFIKRSAMFSYRHKWPVIAVWLVMFVAMSAVSGRLADVLTQDLNDLSGSDSSKAQELIQDRFGKLPYTESIVLRSEAEGTDAPTFQRVVYELSSRLRGLEGVRSVSTYLDGGGESLVSEDGHAALTQVMLVGPELKDAKEQVEPVLNVFHSMETPRGYTLNIVGNASSSKEISEIDDHDLKRAETLGIPIAVIVMTLTFGSLVAAGVPLLLGVAAIVLAMGAVALMGEAFDLSSTITSMITMVGLAVGIDYSMFIVGRYRQEIARGRTPLEAMGIAADSSSRAVFFSGITVLLALGGLLLVPINVFISIGAGAMTVVAFAILGSLTFLPALLGALGTKVFWLKVPLLGATSTDSRFWRLITRRVQARPTLAIVLTGAVLLAAAFPLRNIDLGTNGIEALPKDTDTYRGIAALQQDFGAGRVEPMRLVLDGDVQSPKAQGLIEQLRGQVEGNSNLHWLGVTADESGRTAMIGIATSSLGTSNADQQSARELRRDAQQLFAGSGMEVHLGGGLPTYVDIKDVLQARLPVVFGVVLGLSFVLLLLVFRSVVIPATSILMNLLSVSAAYGLLVAVFQQDFLTSELGFDKSEQLEFWLPLFLFCILFGLSMDYHVFLLSRIQAEYRVSGDNTSAVGSGVVHTAGMITSAAIIMVAVFVGFAQAHSVVLQQMGFGLAVAILIDATLIRSLLVPAVMQKLGRFNWWLPSFLDWLPRLAVETPGGQKQTAATVYIHRAQPGGGSLSAHFTEVDSSKFSSPSSRGAGPHKDNPGRTPRRGA